MNGEDKLANMKKEIHKKGLTIDETIKDRRISNKRWLVLLLVCLSTVK